MEWLSRRTFLRAALASVVGAGGAYAHARLVEPHWLDVVHLELPLRGLPDAFAGFTIAQISDLHFGPLTELADLNAAIDQVCAMRPDAVVITGDIVSRVDQGEPDRVAATLARLRAPHGVFAILGNHDWWVGQRAVADALTSAGVTLLSNRHHPLQSGGQSLYLAGVDDVWCGKHDLAAALRGIPPGAAIVALVHEPDYADTVKHDARVILQLSGHSHGGQMRVPFYGGVWFPPFGRKYPIGLYEVGDLTLYTNRGVGQVFGKMRFACRPEVTRITLMPLA